MKVLSRLHVLIARTMISPWNSRSTVANLGGDREKASWPMALRDAPHRPLPLIHPMSDVAPSEANSIQGSLFSRACVWLTFCIPLNSHFSMG